MMWARLSVNTYSRWSSFTIELNFFDNLIKFVCFLIAILYLFDKVSKECVQKWYFLLFDSKIRNCMSLTHWENCQSLTSYRSILTTKVLTSKKRRNLLIKFKISELHSMIMDSGLQLQTKFFQRKLQIVSEWKARWDCQNRNKSS